MVISKRTFGYHWLASLGAVQSDQKNLLGAAAARASRAGCMLFELACNPVNQLPAEIAARQLLSGGIGSASYCRFFPGDLSCGDPISKDAGLVDKAVATIEADIQYALEVRKIGIVIDHFTGPSVFVLGKPYGYSRNEARDRISQYLHRIVPKTADAGIQLNIEYLRPGEDCGTIECAEELVTILDMHMHPMVKAHGDTFHMSMRNEVPHVVIQKLGKRLGYLHAHGTNRLPPGAYDGENPIATDGINWHLVACALNEVAYEGPVVPEPFGEKIRTQVPALGEGLPPAIDDGLYYSKAAQHLKRQGIIS